MKYLIKIRPPGPDIKSVTVPRVLIGRGIIRGCHNEVSLGFARRMSDPANDWKANSSSFSLWKFDTRKDRRLRRVCQSPSGLGLRALLAHGPDIFASSGRLTG